jgi:hypothetical protein
LPGGRSSIHEAESKEERERELSREKLEKKREDVRECKI